MCTCLQIVTFLVLSILAASVFVVFVLGLSIAGVVVDNHHERVRNIGTITKPMRNKKLNIDETMILVFVCCINK